MQVYGSVTMESARHLFSPGIREIFVGKFTKDSLEDFLKTRSIEMILDATHPFADQISALAMQVCATQRMTHLRYERPSLTQSFSPDRFEWVETLEAAAQKFLEVPGNFLVATGAKNIAPFLSEALRPRAFFRMLKTELGESRVGQYHLEGRVWWDDPDPSETSVRDFLQTHDIRSAIVKDSGSQGIAFALAKLCAALGIQLYLLCRPHLAYPLVCSSRPELEAVLNKSHLPVG